MMKILLKKITASLLLITASTLSHAALVVNDSNACQKIAGVSKPFVLKLKSGTDIPEAVYHCVKNAKLERAEIIGVGDLGNPELTYFKVQEKEFQHKKFTGIYEISSLTGEIYPAAEKIYERVNLHATLADANYQTIGGHLYRGAVGAIAAITIIPITD